VCNAPFVIDGHGAIYMYDLGDLKHVYNRFGHLASRIIEIIDRSASQ